MCVNACDLTNKIILTTLAGFSKVKGPRSTHKMIKIQFQRQFLSKFHFLTFFLVIKDKVGLGVAWFCETGSNTKYFLSRTTFRTSDNTQTSVKDFLLRNQSFA